MIDDSLKIAIGIPTFQREQVLIDVLENILSQSQLPDEIIVADQTPQHDSSTQDALDQLILQKRIKLLRLAEPSLTAARNLVLQNTSCDFVLFIDDDVFLPHDYIAQYSVALAKPGISLVTGPILNLAAGLLPSDALSAFLNLPRNSCRQIVSQLEIDELVRGGNFAVRTSAAIEVNGFDENFVGPAHGEEGDFARRLLMQGREVFYCEKLVLVHLKVPYGGCRVPGNRYWAEWQKPMNLLLLNFRYPEFSKAWLLRFISALRNGPLLRENLHVNRFIPSLFYFVRAIYEAGKRQRRIKSSFKAQVLQGTAVD